MSGFGDWFHVSKEEQAQRRADMSKRVFRFGDEEQRPVVAKVLDGLFGNKHGFSDQDQLFGYISSRNAFAIAYEKDPETANAAACKQLRSLGWRKDERIRIMLALLDLDAKAPSLEEYPTAEQVLELAPKMQLVYEQKQKSKQIQFRGFKF